MEKIDIDLFLDANEGYDKYCKKYKKHEQEWEDRKRNYIADYQEYIPGGIFSTGYYTKRPDVGKIEADKIYGKDFISYHGKLKTFNEWKINSNSLSSIGQQEVIDKVNEIIDFINNYDQ